MRRPAPAPYYNDHPDAIIDDFDRTEYDAVLREVERHVIEWEKQRTDEQRRCRTGRKR